MLHVDDERVRELLLQGGFGLERESLRVTPDGHLSHTVNPFPGNDHIVRDFSENQVEINTSPVDTPQEAIDELLRYDQVVQTTLAALPQPELLWPFSNPPYIVDEEDVPIAQYAGADAGKTVYRQHLSDVYGRYKMTFSGIHFNYSFADELLEADFALTGRPQEEFTAYKDRLYLDLAERAVAYCWLMGAVTAASPLLDSSYMEQGVYDQDIFCGIASMRCSEMGYWNIFAPILDYSSLPAYADSIQSYVDQGLIRYPSELYYPIRIKPRGAYGLDALRAGSVSHIELRMFDLNPLEPAGLNVQDVLFAQLMLVWLAGTPRQLFSPKDQVQAIQNFKNAARYDLDTVKIVVPDGDVFTVRQAALNIIGFMERFYAGFPPYVQDCLAFQKRKFTQPETRYCVQVRRQFEGGFVKKGLAQARANQQRWL